jgi:hypothetical protein
MRLLGLGGIRKPGMGRQLPRGLLQTGHRRDNTEVDRPMGQIGPEQAVATGSFRAARIARSSRFNADPLAQSWPTQSELATSHAYHGDSLRSAANRLARLELLFRIERQLDHSLEQLVRRCSRKILEHQLFDVQSYQVTQLQRTIARRKHKVAMTAVDDDDIAIAIETAAPQFSGRPLERVTRQAARIDNRRTHGGVPNCRSR